MSSSLIHNHLKSYLRIIPICLAKASARTTMSNPTVKPTYQQPQQLLLQPSLQPQPLLEQPQLLPQPPQQMSKRIIMIIHEQELSPKKLLHIFVYLPSSFTIPVYCKSPWVVTTILIIFCKKVFPRYSGRNGTKPYSLQRFPIPLQICRTFQY